MIVFVHTITPRVEYIIDFIAREISGVAWTITSDKETYLSVDGPRINYSDQPVSNNELHIVPHPLLWEKNIGPQEIDIFSFHSRPAFFATTGHHAFDIFAASFYLLTRYEEYLPHAKDEYGRYAHTNSLAYKNGFLDIPLVNYWVLDFQTVLIQQFPSLQLSDKTFRFFPTYDIDEAFSYKHKRWWRTIGATAKAVIKNDWARIRERQKVLRGQLQDPYDSFDWMDELHTKYNLHPCYFFLLPSRNSRYDRNILPDEQGLQSVIRKHAARYCVGIHPSWQTGDRTELFAQEIATLKRISGKDIHISRQHYIRLSIPPTFRQLIEAGIQQDFSMGYGSINGFRASVSSSFYWYDLEKETTTTLELHPFCYMEANSFFEQQYTPSQALEEIRHYHRQVRAVKGTLITLWHNTFLGTEQRFAGWREIYATAINEIMAG